MIVDLPAPIDELRAEITPKTHAEIMAQSGGIDGLLNEPYRTYIVGTMVHYILPYGPNKGQTRPAILVRLSPLGGVVAADLCVFHLGSSDGIPGGHDSNPALKLAAPYSEDSAQAGTWHFI